MQNIPGRTADKIAELRGDLLRWFDAQQRDLPWRRKRNPYAIWISEVMLQQTQVKTVIPYWERFLAAFPTLESLAKAPLSEVLAMWGGLGYYSRARNLHRAANEVVHDFGGKFPRTANELRQLPGFGRYTAGAVASIAFGESTPVVDGNASRVLSRLCAVTGPNGDAARERLIWSIASEWVDKERPGDWNQALMELGATLCRSENPLCLICPVASHCQALRRGLVPACPSPKPARPRKEIHWSVAVWRRKSHLLFARRPEAGLFGGLWELPVVEYDPSASVALESIWEKRIGSPVKVVRSLGTVRRTLTHRELTLHLFQVVGRRLPGSLHGYTEVRWVTPLDAQKLAISSAMSKAVDLAVRTAR